MPLFHVKCLDKQGKARDFILEDQSEEALIHNLQQRGFCPLEIKIASEGSIPRSWDEFPKQFKLSVIDLPRIHALLDALSRGDLNSYEEVLALLRQSLLKLEEYAPAETELSKKLIKDLLDLMQSAGTAEKACRILETRREDIERSFFYPLDIPQQKKKSRFMSILSAFFNRR